MNLVGEKSTPLVGQNLLPGKSNDYVGSDPSRWHTDIPNYGKVEAADAYPGIDLTYFGSQSQLEYNFSVSPGADPGAITLGFQGTTRIQLDGQGNLVLTAPNGSEVVQQKPQIYQEADGARVDVAGGFVLEGGGRVGFQVGNYDPSRPLVIDPVLLASTFMNHSGYTGQLTGVGADPQGNIYVAGSNYDVNPFFGPGANQTFVEELNPAGTAVLYTTRLSHEGGGTSGLAVDSFGNAYVTGYDLLNNLAASGGLGYPGTPLPIVNGVATGLDPNGIYSTAFVAKLDPAGKIAYSTYLGGTATSRGTAVAVDDAGRIYVTGSNSARDFPAMNPLPAAQQGAGGGFVAKIDPSQSGAASIVYSTPIDAAGVGIGVDGARDAYVVGNSPSAQFPAVHALQPKPGGSGEAFVLKLNPSGSALTYSTYLGGSGNDSASGVAVDPLGDAYVVGSTQSQDFPTARPIQKSLSGGQDAFVTKVDPTGSTLLYSTYLGGSGADQGNGIALDAAGDAYVVGSTQSKDFPTVLP
ncbi:MAG: SBBP repeat-containing protein, partial [Planctomycetia bacterium]|nr:SBBP repeat-containing protein [Planctomycetia bacterium]